MNSLAKLVTTRAPGIKNRGGRLYNPIVLPSSLPGLLLWLKADSLGLNDGDAISAWTDSALLQANATASGTARPTYKTGIQNGKPIVRFNGTSNIMSLTGLTKGVFTAFYVYKANVQGLLVEHSVNAGSNPGDYHYIPGGAHFAANGAGGFSAFDITTSLTTFTWRILSRSMDGTNAGHLAYVNGTLATRSSSSGTGNPGTATSNATLFLGGRSGGTLLTAADYAEIIYFNTVLSIANHKTVLAYLSNKWGVAVAP